MQTSWQIYASIAKDVITASAAVTAAVVAVKGLRAWKKQLRGKTDYELARRCLKAVYRVRDGIRMVRNPLQSSEEIAAGMTPNFQLRVQRKFAVNEHAFLFSFEELSAVYWLMCNRQT